jgi:cell division protein FtsQ
LGCLAVVGGVTASTLMLRSALERDNRFRIAGTANIQSEGLSEVSRADLLPVFGEDIGKNIFFVHLDQRRHDLEAIPWVKRATVMRVLPDRIRVTLVERTPVAFTQIGGETGLVDAEGVLLTMSAATMAERHYSFPAVNGLDVSVSPGGQASASERRTRMGVYMRMMADLDSNGQHNTQQISEVDLSDPEDARVKMADQGGDIVAHLGNDHFLDRYRRYMKHIGEWRQQYPRLVGVDLRYERQAVLQMAPEGMPMPGEAPATVQTATGQSAPAQPAAVAAAKPPTTAVHPQAAGGKAQKIEAAHNTGKTKPALRTDSHAEKATMLRLKAERARTEKTRALQQQQHKRDEQRRVAPITAQHKSQPAVHAVSPAVEGQ